MKLLSNIRSELHTRLLDLRNLDRFVMTESFQAAYNSATKEDQQIVVDFINKSDRDKVFKWTKIQLQKSRIIEELPVAELRSLCAGLGVRNYRYLTKDGLITAIRNKNEEAKNVGTICIATPRNVELNC